MARKLLIKTVQKQTGLTDKKQIQTYYASQNKKVAYSGKEGAYYIG